MKVLRLALFTSIVVVITLSVTQRSRTYRYISAPLLGQWAGDGTPETVAAFLSREVVRLTYPDAYPVARTEVCAIESVRIYHSLFRGARTIDVRCDIKRSSKSVCQGLTGRKKLYEWSLHLTQEDPENYGEIDLSESTDTNCAGEMRRRPLATMYKG